MPFVPLLLLCLENCLCILVCQYIKGVFPTCLIGTLGSSGVLGGISFFTGLSLLFGSSGAASFFGDVFALASFLVGAFGCGDAPGAASFCLVMLLI